LIFLLRHGQTEYNAEGRIQGQCDSTLTPLGREQARILGLILRQNLADADGFELVSSPLGRTMATAEIVREAAGIGAPLATDALLLEIGCGSWETRLRSFCREEAGVGPEVSFIDTWRHHCPDGESYEAAMDRARRWLEWAEGRKVVAVAHGIIGIFLRGLYVGLPEEVMSTMPVPQDRVFRLHGGAVDELVLSADGHEIIPDSV
jgi:probable phosphoglycerate mutase